MRLSTLWLSLMGLSLVACSRPPGGSGEDAGPGDAQLSALQLAPELGVLPVGESRSLAATGVYSDGSTRDLTTEVQWASSNPAVATLSPAGALVTVAEGATTLSAVLGDVRVAVHLLVSSKTLESIALAPVGLELGLGAAQRFTATATFSDQSTRNVSAQVVWSSSAPEHAPVSEDGVVNALTLGTTTLGVTWGGKAATSQVTVVAKRLTSIAVTPAYSVIVVGGTQQLTATGTYSDGSTLDVTASAQWTSEYPDGATVDSGGQVTGMGAFQGNGIVARMGAVSARSRVSVTTAEFALVSLAFDPQRMFVGQEFLFPTVFGNFGPVGSNYPYLSWTSSNPAVAIVDPERGLTALTVGTTTLTASTATGTGTLSATNTLTVTEPPLTTLRVLPESAQLAQGTTLQLSATGVYADSTLNTTLGSGVTWTSSNPAAVRVDGNGRAEAVGSGTATVSASSGSVTGTSQITVPTVVPPQMTVALSPTDDNTLMLSSLNASRETTVFPFNALFETPGIAVGCSWYYSPPIGFAPERIDASCSQAVLKFDLSALAGKTVLSAKLQLQTAYYGVGYVPRRWFIQAMATPWTGSTVTWRSAYSFQNYVYSETQHDPPVFSGQLFELDQTQTVKNWVGGVYVNQGLRMGITNYLMPAINTDSLDQFEFHSSEDSSGRGPKLVVTYQ